MPGPAYASAYRQQQEQRQGEEEQEQGGRYGGPVAFKQQQQRQQQYHHHHQPGAYEAAVAAAAGQRQGQGQGHWQGQAHGQGTGPIGDEYANYGNSIIDSNTISNPDHTDMMASSPSNGYGGPSSYAPARSNQFYQQPQQQPRHQQYQQQQQDDVQSSFGGSAYMNGPGGAGGGAESVNGNGLPSPTSMSGGGSNNNGAGGGPSSTAQASTAAPGKGNTPEDIENSRRIAKVHFAEFKAYLDAEGQRDPNARANAREKLTRLTRPQFQELSTDVYDELMRRQRAANAPEGTAPEYLPQKPEFHPKRNQAREKLSTLPKTRFRDLASDVYFELERRYPEFREPEVPMEELSGYDAGSRISASNSNSRGAPAPQRSASRDEGSRYQLGNAQQQQQPQQQRRPQFPQGKPSSGMEGQQQQSYQGQNAGSAANEVIIPNKSKVVEEEISLPGGANANAQQGGQQRGYGNYANNQSALAMGRKSSERERAVNGMAAGASPNEFDTEPASPSNSHSQSQSGLTQSSDPVRRPSNEAPRIGNLNGPQLGATSPDWSSSFARASEASSLGTRLIGGYGTSTTPSEGGLRGDWESDELEKVKSDYEYKIATMQNRLQGLEKDLRDAQDASQKAAAEATRAANAENELAKLKERHEDALSNIDQLEQELAEAQDKVSVPAYAPPVSREEDKNEIARLQRELDTMKTKYNSQVDATENLRKEIEGLVDTLKEMNLHQDELANEREDDQARIAQLSEEAKDWKGRYEAAKTELREIKTTSQLFVKPTKADDDYMPTSPNGAILDSHVTRFQSSIDDLLISGRSDAPSSVIIATKQVINAVARIDEDVQEYESVGLADMLSPDDRERLLALKSKCNATLSNLTTAARNHATGHGLSPVSLLDAAASHLSNTIIELVRLVAMRKAGTSLVTEGSSNTSMKQSLSSSLSSSSLSNQHQKTPSFSSSQTQSRGLPTRLASLKRDDDSASAGQPGINGSSGRSSSASVRSRTITTSDRTQATSVDEPALKADTSFSSGLSNAFNRSQPQQQINPSGSDTSLASNFRPDPRRNAGQHNLPPSFDSQTSLRSQVPTDSQDDRGQNKPDFGEDDEDVRDYAQEQDDSREAPDPSQDPEAWAELKNYLEQQTEAIVHSITALLAAIRGGAQPAKLQENLSQIITIVSTVVQILQDNLPPSLHEDSEPIIQDLSQNCQKLIDLQGPADGSPQTFSKQTKQAMATASFGVAKSLKSVNSLLASV